MVALTVEPMPARRIREYGPRREMPAGLTPIEASVYTRGFSRGCLTYGRKHGTPAVTLEGPAPAAGTAARRELGARLSELTAAHEKERHPTAHRAGMAALKKYRTANGLPNLAAVPAPRNTRRAARKVAPVDTAPAPDVDETPAAAAAPVPAAPADVLAAGVESGRVIILPVSAPAPVETVDTAPRNTRRAARRQLAEDMRARGEDPRDADAWTAAKLAAGVK